LSVNLKIMSRIGCFFIVILLCINAGALSSQQNTATRQVVASTGQDGDIFYHTVERGQTVYSLSVMYGVSEEDIYNLNPGSREVIKAGEILKIPQRNTAEQAENNGEVFLFHTIAQGETLYGVSRKYGVSVNDISEANQGLTPQSFAAGKTIRIPSMKISTVPETTTKVVVKELEYKIKRKETMYSLCRKFNVTSEELLEHNPQLKSGVKSGMTIKIPVKTEEVVTESAAPKELDINELIKYREEVRKTDVARIGLLLPLFEGTSTTPFDIRVVEFYEGFLMAVDSLRNSGMSVELFVYDIGNDVRKTREALSNNDLQSVHLLVGGMTNEQIALIANFAKEHEINYAVPFSSKCEQITMSNPYVFQVVASLQNLYSYATPRIRTMFANHRIILLKTPETADKQQFINVLKAELSDNGVPYTELTYKEQSFSADLQALLTDKSPNVIIPISSSMEALLKIKGTLRSIVETKPEYTVTLFGHPEWQNYLNFNQILEDFYILNARIYTPSFINMLSPQAKTFSSRYKALYHKPLATNSPKFSVLGFDLGVYFLTAIRLYGSEFEDYISQIRYNSLQTGFRFERVNNWGGFFNTNLYIVGFNKTDYSITRE